MHLQLRELEKAAAVAGIWSGVFEENSRKIAGRLREIFPESRDALTSSTSGTEKDKPAANLGSTLPGTLSQPSVRGFLFNRQL